jgi:two-component system, sensor histidine kinase and response regulator
LSQEQVCIGNIIAVDDNAVSLRLLEGMLRKSGYQVRSFSRARPALEAAAERAPELFLLDISMPEMSGYEMCSQLKSDETLQRIPVIFLSASDNAMDKVRAFRCGGADYVTKPFQIDEVRARVEAQLELFRTRQSEKELLRMRSQFISIASHEFRTPLTVILSSTELLEIHAAKLTPEKRNVYIHRIQTAARHMTELLSDVLLIGKADAERVTVRSAPLDADALVATLLDDLRGSFAASASFSVQTAGAPQPVTTDAKLLRAILQNLLSNAVKYSRGDRVTVTILIEYRGSGLEIAVADDGIGIPEKDQGNLFELFHRGSNTKSVPGTGLGLAIVKRFVKALGGSVRFQSSEGEGSRFTIALPYEGAKDRVA